MTICQGFNGSVTLLHKGNMLAYRTRQQGEPAVIIADDKIVLNQVDQALHRQQKPTWKPAPDHPWRRPLTRIKQQYLIMNMKRGHYCFGLTTNWQDTEMVQGQSGKAKSCPVTHIAVRAHPLDLVPLHRYQYPFT